MVNANFLIEVTENSKLHYVLKHCLRAATLGQESFSYEGKLDAETISELRCKGIVVVPRPDDGDYPSSYLFKWDKKSVNLQKKNNMHAVATDAINNGQ